MSGSLVAKQEWSAAVLRTFWGTHLAWLSFWHNPKKASKHLTVKIVKSDS
jgi:hypothetical protein